MACESIRKSNQTKEQRKVEVQAALKKLDLALASGKVTLAVGPQGGVVFVGWSPADRNDVTDACAFRTLQSQGSGALLRALADAEMRAGRKVNPTMVAAGTHSHDGGKTWHSGH